SGCCGVLADVERRLAVANDDRSRAKQRIEFAMAQAAHWTRWIRALKPLCEARPLEPKLAAVRKELAAKTAQLERLRNRHGDELGRAPFSGPAIKRAERESRSARTALAERRCDRGRIETEPLSHLLREQKRDRCRQALVGGATYQTPAAGAMQNRRLPPCAWPKLKSAGPKLRMRKRCWQGELHVFIGRFWR
uniref:CHAD domain-containing protein n=1 Tax=Macrostomum lignano TaxID=282301 RepID=A0A1I8FJD4_9PLAT